MYYNYRTHCSHPQHVLVRCQYSNNSVHACNLCDAGFRGLIGLRCKACDFDIHEACADYFQPATNSFAHPWHGLALGRVADDDRACDLCAEECPRGSFVYRCVPCGFDVHPLCTMFPAKVKSPLHPDHELAMVPAGSAAAVAMAPAVVGQNYCLCSGCGEAFGGWFYRCGTCGVGLHVECLNGARIKPRAGGGGQSAGAGSSQGNGGGGGGGGRLKPSRSSLVGKFLLRAAVRVAVDAATNGLASAVLGGGGGGGGDCDDT
uniref:Phorbol-ester/DAG-type domain-containing protein n=1 Tax=Leersia perrieri TaxID=77586 RepID=A0A0D9X1D1_9ORYZ